MPDAVGNLFKTAQKNDREYGPAGQLLAVHSSKGTTRYEYDAEGNLVRKIEPNGKVWKYEWNGAGHMAKVIRPDGQEIRFEYEALGRRIQKIVGNKTAHWVWEGNNPLHEWVDYKLTATQTINAQNTRHQDANAETAAIASLDALSTVFDHQGPPSSEARFNEGTQAQPITWLFEPDSFTPMAKLVGDEHYSIITDHLGTPSSVFDKDGHQVWSADISVWGELRNLQGDKDFCPFRYPGQYEDSETGLYYNRFRYYDPEAGRYVSQDPIGLAGCKLRLFEYVTNPTTRIDSLGLLELVYQLIKDGKVVYYGITERTAEARLGEHVRGDKAFDHMEVIADNLTHDQARSLEGGLIRQRLEDCIGQYEATDSIETQLSKSGLLNKNRGRDIERWNPKKPLRDVPRLDTPRKVTSCTGK